MKKERIENIPLPDYTKREEFLNSASHAAGVFFGIGALIACVGVSAYAHYKAGIITGIIYGLSMIMLYLNSSVYHGLQPSLAKKVMRVVDHCTIFIFILGCYTPMLLTGIREDNPKLAWGVFISVCVAGAIGLTLTAIDVHRFKVFSLACYLVIGWCFALIAKQALKTYPLPFTVLLFTGGGLYTIGALLYVLGKRNHRYFHSIFHFFILAGSILHFVAILMYCMNR